MCIWHLTWHSVYRQHVGIPLFAINRRFYRNGKGSSIKVVPKQGRDGHSINADVGREGHLYADVRSPIYYTIHKGWHQEIKKQDITELEVLATSTHDTGTSRQLPPQQGIG